jgi:tol-pal system protein YbgF
MRRLLLTLPLALLLPGCAMKADVRNLQLQVDSLRMSQERMMRTIEQQNQQLVQAIESHNARLRGDVLTQLHRIDQQLVQVQELTGQGQQRLAELREQMRQREEALRTAPAQGGSASGEGAQELYDAALASLQRGSHATARAGFEELIRSFPRDARAPMAQLQIGESYAAAGDHARAAESFGRVAELYPTSPAAATGLFRQAETEVRRNNRARARTLFTQVTTAYPNSPEAPRARAELQRLR